MPAEASRDASVALDRGGLLRLVAISGVCLAVAVLMRLAGATDLMADSLALVLMAIGLWAFSVLPEPVTGLAFFLGAVTLVGIEPAIVFSGFTTSAFWLVFSGMVLSAAVNQTGFSRWLASRFLAARSERMGYRAWLAVIVLFGAALALILPSTLARVAVLMPVVAGLCDRLGYLDGGSGRTGMILAAAIGTYIVPTTFLPANLPNIVLTGSLESLYGVTTTFGSYLLLHFPVIGLIKGVALVVILNHLFRETGSPTADRNAAERPALSASGLRLGVVLALTLTIWSLDSLHGIAPAWVGLAAAVICLLPFVGILDLKQVPFNAVFSVILYVAAVLGIGGVMTASGAGEALSRFIVDSLPLAEANDALRLAMLTFAATVTALVTTMPVAPAVTAPFFGEIAAVTSWSVEAVGMSQVLGYATPLLPYQLPPLMMAIAMTGIAMRDATRVLIVLAITTSPLMLVAAPFWWGFLDRY